MESYKSYFDRQTVSPELHEKLLAIGRQPRTERRRRPLSPAWKKVGGSGRLLRSGPGTGAVAAVRPRGDGKRRLCSPCRLLPAGGFLFPQRGEPGIRLSGGRF